MTLDNYAVLDNGLECVKDIPIVTTWRGQMVDVDVKAAYPFGQVITNGSKETTAVEVLNIEGVNGHQRRMAGINMTSGPTDVLEVGRTLLNLPHALDVLEAYELEMAG